MTKLVVRRLAALPLIIFATAVIVFALAWASPFDPGEAYVMAYGPNVSAELREQYIAAWGVDQPMPQQFVAWLGNLVQGDLGTSRLLAGQPVAEALAARAWPSLVLLGTALLLILVFGLIAGVLAATFRDTWVDWVIRTSAYFTVFAPSFWVGLLAIYLFSVQLGWLPSGGMSDPRMSTGGRLDPAYLVLPAITLALSQHGWFTMYVRNTMLEVMREDYVRFARAQGMSGTRILFRHVLPNSLVPYFTLIGAHIPELIGGSVLVESIFGWPGLGNLTRQAAIAVDLPLLLAIILVGAVLVVLGNLLADLLYRTVDPRVREVMQ